MANAPTEETRVSISQERGRRAAAMLKMGKSNKDVQAYIAKQGESETAARKSNATIGKQAGYSSDIDEDTDFHSFHSGGTIPKDGLYRLKAGEKVIPALTSGGSSGGGRTMSHGQHTGAAENFRPGGPDESGVSRQNSPFRQLHEGGHMLNHGYKHPPAAIAPDIVAAGRNHSYMNPMDTGGGRLSAEVPKQVWKNANTVKPITQQGTGKSGPAKLS